MKKFNDLIFENKQRNNKYNKIIDFTYLKNDVTVDKIKEVCEIAKKYNFYSVCVKPEYVSYSKQFLMDSDIKVVTVISFPKGNDKTKDKISQIEDSIIYGVDEIDMVMDYKLLKSLSKITDSEKYEQKINIIKNELFSVARLCHGINSVILKIIIETGDLTLEQIKLSCDICVETGVDYVMTSTGLSKNGAEESKVRFMRKILPDSIKIKASGGIRTLNDIEKFVNNGADRIGTSSNPYLLS